MPIHTNANHTAFTDAQGIHLRITRADAKRARRDTTGTLASKSRDT